MRLATVTASRDISLIEVDGDALLKTSDRLQARFAEAFLNLTVARLDAANQRLAIARE